MEKRLSILNGVHSCPRAVAHWSRPELERLSRDTSQLLSDKKGCPKEHSQQPVLSVKDFSPPNPLNRTFPPSKHVLIRNNSFDNNETFFNEMVCVNDSNVFGDQMSLLKGFQTIEMIDRIVINFQTGKNHFEELDAGFTNFIRKTLQIRLCPATKISSQNLRALAFYHDKLVGLLKERCCIGLQKECVLHIKELKCFVTELIALKYDEAAKVKLHLRGNGKTITNIYFCRQRKLAEHLEHHCRRWSTVLQRVNRMISIFHVNWDSRLHDLLAYTERTIKYLLVEAFYWTLMILQDNFKILCSKDQHTLPSDVLQNFYSSLDSYNNLLGHQILGNSQQDFCSTCLAFNNFQKCIFCQLQVFTHSFALKILGKFQSSIAAGNVLDVLTAEWRNCELLEMEQQVMWINQIQGFERPFSVNLVNTSDYYTNSETESSVNTKDTVESNEEDETSAFSLNSAMLKVMQKNQTYLLKHLFAMTCISSFSFSEKTKNVDTEVRFKQTTGSRQKWPKAKPKSGSEMSSSHLERKFWQHFWQELEASVLQLTLYSSGQSLKNSRLGSTAFLPAQFVFYFCRKAKETRTNSDLCPEAISTMYNISQKLYIRTALGSWDEYFCKSLKLSMGHRYPPVPILNGCIGTAAGKCFSLALEPVLCVLLSAHILNEDSAIAMAALCLQSTVDYIASWASSKMFCFLNSWQIATFLLISLSDLNECYNLLETFTNIFNILHPSHVPESWVHFWKLSSQMNSIKVNLSHIEERVYQKSYVRCHQIFESCMPKSKYWKRWKTETKLQSIYKKELVAEVLDPAMSALSRVGASSRFSIASKITNALGKSWIDFLLGKRIYFSAVGAYQLKCDVNFFLTWVRDSQFSSEIKREFPRSDGFLKLEAVTKVLSGDRSKSGSALPSNRVAPAVSEEETGSQDSFPTWYLSASEVQVWKSLRTSYPFSVFCCLER